MIYQPACARKIISRSSQEAALAPFLIFLESLPQFDPTDITWVLDDEKGSRVYPSEEFTGKEWLRTASTPRWYSMNEAIEWAYDILEGSTIGHYHMYDAFRRTLGSPRYSSIGGHLCRYMEYQYAVREPQIVSNACSFTSKTAPVDLRHEEVRQLFENFLDKRKKSISLLLWHNSLLELAVTWPTVLKTFLSKAAAGSPHIYTLATDGVGHLGKVAQRFLELPLPHGLTDAELLEQILPWGRRSLAYYFDSLDAGPASMLGFCYLKPLREHPPIRIEFSASGFLGNSLDVSLDLVLAFLILNPNVI